jgi:hypothetical protein
MKYSEKAISLFTTMLTMTGYGGRVRYKDPLEGIDIEKEYQLIQQKKSRLSASMRREVVNRYERYFSKNIGK